MKLNLLLLSAAALVNAATADEVKSVLLGTAGDYTILAATGISTVNPSDITGDIAVSPITGTAMTGFDLAMDSEGVFAIASQFTGKAYAVDFKAPSPVDLTAAVGYMETAYTDAAKVNLEDGAIGGETLSPGVYTFDRDISIGTATQVFFDAGGDPNAVFIIRTSKNLVQAANTKVVLVDRAKAENIFWQVAGEVNVGAGAHLKGVLLVKTAVNFVTGSSLSGRILAQTAVSLQMATIAP
jgi:hypothetical protein